jgi:hypothetical protein
MNGNLLTENRLKTSKKDQNHASRIGAFEYRNWAMSVECLNIFEYFFISI